MSTQDFYDTYKDLIEDWKKSPLGLEKEILFKSENPDLKLNDYFELDILIQEMIEKRLGK